MITTGSGICLVISVLVTIFIVLKSHGHVDSYDGASAVLLPFLILAYWLKAQVSAPESALLIIAFIEMATCLLLAVTMFSMLRSIGIMPRLWAKAVVYGAVAALLFPLWRILHNGTSAEYVEILPTEDGYTARTTSAFYAYGHYAFVLAVITVVICAVAFFLSRKKNYSRRFILGYLVFILAWIALYTVEAVLKTHFTGLPFLYLLAQILQVMTYDQVHAHDLTGLIAENQETRTARGYVAIGTNGKFLNASEKAVEFLPELRDQRPDTRFSDDSLTGKRFSRMIRHYTENNVSSGSFLSGDRILAYEISGFSIQKGGPVRGWRIDIRDATEERKNLEILTDYNNRLNREVAEKTRNIEAIQEKLVLSMADMVENRDGNTGGHVRRTSDIVAILVREIQENHLFPLEESLARDIIRTAPMHDLGKVSIDSGILNKPARLTPEEYAIMKTHSTISGQMVKILLDGVEEESLVRTAYRLARHHHERWDGKGYPDGLVGETIPLEARIMAVADVYDALVSKRVYKEPMSYEKAARIMCEGMGTQFDPNMRLVFLRCRKALEDYYSAIP